MRSRYDASHAAGDRDPHELLRALAWSQPVGGGGAADEGVLTAGGGVPAAGPGALTAASGGVTEPDSEIEADAAGLRSAAGTPGGAAAPEDGPGWVPDGDPRAGRTSLGQRIARSGPWGALAEKWVPEPMRGARVDPSRHGAMALSAVAALSAVIAAVGVWWARPQPVPVSATPVLASAVGQADPTEPEDRRASADDTDGDVGSSALADAGGVPPSQAPTTAPTGPILVSVTGAVHRPGLVTVPAGARVADAIAAAGDALDEGDLVGLNLAAKLADGDSVVVAGPAGSVIDAAQSGDEQLAASGAGSITSLININGADLPELQELPGVGPVTAQAIITYRTEHGPFVAAEQLQEVPGIGPATMARLGPLITW